MPKIDSLAYHRPKNRPLAYVRPTQKAYQKPWFVTPALLQSTEWFDIWSSFCIITYTCYKLLEMVQFFVAYPLLLYFHTIDNIKPAFMSKLNVFDRDGLGSQCIGTSTRLQLVLEQQQQHIVTIVW